MTHMRGHREELLLQSPCDTEGHILGISHLEHIAFSVGKRERKIGNCSWAFPFFLLCNWDTYTHIFLAPQTGHITLSYLQADQQIQSKCAEFGWAILFLPQASKMSYIYIYNFSQYFDLDLFSKIPKVSFSTFSQGGPNLSSTVVPGGLSW